MNQMVPSRRTTTSLGELSRPPRCPVDHGRRRTPCRAVDPADRARAGTSCPARRRAASRRAPGSCRSRRWPAAARPSPAPARAGSGSRPAASRLMSTSGTSRPASRRVPRQGGEVERVLVCEVDRALVRLDVEHLRQRPGRRPVTASNSGSYAVKPASAARSPPARRSMVTGTPDGSGAAAQVSGEPCCGTLRPHDRLGEGAGAEPGRDGLGHPQRVGDDRQRRVHRGAGDEEARVGDVDVVELVQLAVQVERRGRGVGAEARPCRSGARHPAMPSRPPT